MGPPTHSIFEEKSPPLQLKEAQRGLESFLQYGGFPEVVVEADAERKQSILDNYKNTYFTRDLSLLSNIEDVTALRAILNHYAQSIGSITQVENFRQASGLSHISTKKYLNSIYQSSLGFTLTGHHYGPAKRYIKGSKSYYCDTGMIAALGVQVNRGQLLENFVISEIEKRRKLKLIKTDQLFFYKSSSGFEIDLIIEEKGEEKDRLRAIEIKSTTRPVEKDVRHLREFVNLDAKKRKGYLFYLGEEYRDIDGIACLPIASLYRGR